LYLIFTLNSSKLYSVVEFLHLLTREGDIVLDPFIGSGSTAVACKLLNQHYIGFELNPEYCQQAQTRLADIQPVLPQLISIASK
jgi:site-specific DNA-methyltransferase (adenine-specific)